MHHAFWQCALVYLLFVATITAKSKTSAGIVSSPIISVSSPGAELLTIPNVTAQSESNLNKNCSIPLSTTAHVLRSIRMLRFVGGFRGWD
jgi:hypothetical protein